MHQILDQTRPAAELFFADVLTEQTCDLESQRVRLAALRQNARYHLEDKDAQDVAGDKSKQDACAILEHLAPFDPDLGEDRRRARNEIEMIMRRRKTR